MKKTTGFLALSLAALVVGLFGISCEPVWVNQPVQQRFDPVPVSDRPTFDNQSFRYRCCADPKMITLGPASSTSGTPYVGKISLDINLPFRAPIIAPLDVTFIGYRNRNAKYRVVNGTRYSPFDDLQLWFRSDDANWPDLIFTVYHLYTSPLLPGHNESQRFDSWGDNSQSEGFLYFQRNLLFSNRNRATESLRAFIGKKLKRGDVIGYAGQVGSNNSFAAVGFKVWDAKKNPLTVTGNPNLHWVQPNTYFSWRTANTTNTNGHFLTYPFECNGFTLPEEMRSPAFKYQP